MMNFSSGIYTVPKTAESSIRNKRLQIIKEAISSFGIKNNSVMVYQIYRLSLCLELLNQPHMLKVF